MHALTFQKNTVIPFDNGDGKIWFTAEALATLLGYADAKQVNRIFQRHKDEFIASMTTMVKVTKRNKNKGIDYNQVRLFSPRGAHLIGMMSRTKIAKELRIWLLDLAEKESGVEVGHLNLETLPQLAGQKMLDAIDVFDKKSLKYRGQRGSGLMAQRKRDIKLIKKATEIALQLTQLSIPDLGDFSDGELA
ncbi:BRO family protein [Plesiomonas shigelloides]|uniref:BRO family protein n=1 Tax=Plesiomonas shigelloides TaxID=703 RepID=UPI00387F2463